MLVLYFVFLILYIVEFFTGSYLLTSTRFAIPTFIILSISFFVKERKETILCPEILMLPVFFVMTFYKEIVLDNMPIVKSSYYQFLNSQYAKGMCVNMIALLSFMIGSKMAKTKGNSCKSMVLSNYRGIPLVVQQTFIVVTCLFAAYAFSSGQMSILNKYQKITNGENTYIVYITILLCVCTIIEFYRLSQLHINSLRGTLRSINKLYLVLVCAFSLILLMTGNRGEALLIIFPVLFSYSFLIKKVNTKIFTLLVAIGVPIMVVIATTRQGDTFDYGEFNFLNIFTDFGSAYLVQTGLIGYSDLYGPIGISVGLRGLFSAIPFLGGFVEAIFPSSKIERSSVLATDLFQSPGNMNSGLGTSLIGDLYYSGGIVWVMFFMMLMGWFMSRCYKRINCQKSIGVYSFIVYIWLCSNSIYMMRAEWYSMFRYFGFSVCIVFCLQLLFRKSNI